MTEFDWAVLAAARIGAITQRVAYRSPGDHIRRMACYMGDQCVDPSIRRLQRAGELFQIAGPDVTSFIFPDTPEWDALAKFRTRLINHHKLRGLI